MKIEKIMTDEANIAVVSSEERIIVDTNSALDLIMTVQYETGADRIVTVSYTHLDVYKRQGSYCR